MYCSGLCVACRGSFLVELGLAQPGLKYSWLVFLHPQEYHAVCVCDGCRLVWGLRAWEVWVQEWRGLGICLTMERNEAQHGS